MITTCLWLELVLAVSTQDAVPTWQPIAECFLWNRDGTFGRSPDARIDAAVHELLADVLEVTVTASELRVRTFGIPSHEMGPFPGNPNLPAPREKSWRIPRVVAPAETCLATPLGPIGIAVNGVPFFNASDGTSWFNEGRWHRNALVSERPTFDAGAGHVDRHGVYHYHALPRLLLAQLQGQDPTQHSPIIGWSFDGHPIYGPYGFLRADGTGGVARMTPSYRLRELRKREGGPSPLIDPPGAFLEDFEHVPGHGTLDEHNGRFAVTPEFPEGTYAYFATIDARGDPVYPYVIGPTYRDLPASNSLSARASEAGTRRHPPREPSGRRPPR